MGSLLKYRLGRLIFGIEQHPDVSQIRYGFLEKFDTSWTGSPPVWNTISIVEVAAFAARPGADVANAAMTAT